MDAANKFWDGDRGRAGWYIIGFMVSLFIPMGLSIVITPPPHWQHRKQWLEKHPNYDENSWMDFLLTPYE